MMRIDVSFPGGLRVDASFDGFTVRTDQPEPWGAGSAPTPFDLFQVSLATCAGIYVLSFCRERNIPTEGLRITQRTERDGETGLLSLAAIEIGLPAGFPDRYRNAVIRAAELCTVKRTVENPPRFTVSVASGSGEGRGEGA